MYDLRNRNSKLKINLILLWNYAKFSFYSFYNSFYQSIQLLILRRNLYFLWSGVCQLRLSVKLVYPFLNIFRKQRCLYTAAKVLRPSRCLEWN